MPISHPHRTIFVHIPKTAGTSVEAVLGMHGEKSDIGLAPYFNQTLDFEHLYGRQMQHLNASGIRQVLNNDAVFHAYFKFTIVRNPWDRLVSALAWTDQKWSKGVELSVLEFEQKLAQLYGVLTTAPATVTPSSLPPFVLPQHSYIYDSGGAMQVDLVAKYETLESDWERIRQRLRIDTALPRRMKSHHRSYREYYTASTRDMVATLYTRDIALFDYEF
jgi:hypothetical protein